MIGKHRVRISNRKVRYDFELKRNITIVQGDSGTGKTTLFDMVAEYTRLRDKSGVNISCDVPCTALIDIDWRNQLKHITGSIVLIDEVAEYITSKDFSRAIKGTDNYYVLFTRENLYELPYSAKEIYRIKTSGKYHTLEPIYKEGKGHLYGQTSQKNIDNVSVVVTEDSKSGYQFYKSVFENAHVDCRSAGANTAIYKWLCEHRDSNIMIIADGAAFGAEMNRIMKAKEQNPDKIIICLPESFEWLILNSGLIKTKELKTVLENTYEYADSKTYFSWEQFYTNCLIHETEGTPFAYKKNRINRIYLIDSNAHQIVEDLRLPSEKKAV